MSTHPNIAPRLLVCVGIYLFIYLFYFYFSPLKEEVWEEGMFWLLGWESHITKTAGKWNAQNQERIYKVQGCPKHPALNVGPLRWS